ncbi:hypothetical protein RJ639_043908 [Escallonia herrerae]|uniref:Pectinesterase n=1 Tax=Escallonia herrerae TaxID=1293975 RepID=A0AA89B9Q4_9ASTE|nr:hypothetical protein RJ639_043908 [Escallonia herrerae]
MDAIKSFKGYEKLDELEEQEFQRKKRKRLVVLIVSSLVLVPVIIGAIAGTITHKRNIEESPSTQASYAASLKALCSSTQYPDSCFTSISALEMSSTTTDPEELFKLSLQVVMNSLSKLSLLPEALINKTNSEGEKAALGVCKTVFGDAIDIINNSISSMDVNNGEKQLSFEKIDDLTTWLSTSITNQETCLDALDESNSTLLADVKGLMKNSTEYWGFYRSSICRYIESYWEHLRIQDFQTGSGQGSQAALGGKPRANVTVTKDRTGDCKTIKEAVAKVPSKSTSRFVIYIKTGKYVENVNLNTSKWNVMVYGDGNNKTIVSGSLNFVDGTPTFSTVAFAVVGKGFIAKDIGFENTAGAEKHQAVAFRSGSDLSVYYRCSFDAFQDTLYAYSGRQFYRKCDITGTIDFIFGNAAVVFQSCNILPRQPLSYQFDTITAQGKTDPNQYRGISIQKCTMYHLDNITTPVYVGRPWKNHSTTVVMQTNIGQFLNPTGWTECISNVEPPSTIFYVEYQNTGPGSSVNDRVKWPGYRSNFTQKQALKFTVQSFLKGNTWLSATNVMFCSSL